MKHPAMKKERDGGYHAIKGFAYQFDASLVRIFENPSSAAELEGKQDLSVENYHIQVKHRSEKFSVSAITSAVQLMFRQFQQDNSSQFILHCHFADQPPGLERELTQDELDRILDDFSDEYDYSTCSKFLSACKIAFRENYQAQFKQVLELIKNRLNARDEIEATYYHAILHGYLRDVVLSNPIGARRVAFRSLRQAISSARTAIFESAYVEQCGYEKYLKAVRKRYTLRTVNIAAERIFSFECDATMDVDVMAEVVLLLRDKYCSKPGHPPPYVTFRGDFDSLEIKKALWDAGARFNDGTGYHGGLFRMQELISPPTSDLKLKVVDGEHLALLMDSVRIKEFHDFYVTEIERTPHKASTASHVFVRSFEDLLQVL
ncbi:MULTISPECIES: hypothetical protein [Streptomyces]|uniref:hypothetical protein n=1 Tax=Streptomyces TaxID=1883 RepID=UPI0027825046|nr:hypothetical protein [Streptomyces afghaniensis]MDQ1018021.1 hypothetical protein [Streptomyces afghaniensis]